MKYVSTKQDSCTSTSDRREFNSSNTFTTNLSLIKLSGYTIKDIVDQGCENARKFFEKLNGK